MLLILLVTLVTVGGVFVPEPDTDVNEVEKYAICPESCVCSFDDMTAQCQFTVFNYSVAELISSKWKLTQLRVHGDSKSWNTENSRLSVRDVLFRQNAAAASDSIEDHVFSNLIHLDVSYVPMRMISDHDFTGMPKLQLLTLTNNNISSVDSNAFKNLVDLVVLNLDGNHISSLSDGQFDNLKKLKRLHLRSNNLSVLNESQLIGLDNLMTLDLQNNHIGQIDTFVQTLNSLETFNVKWNKIMHISVEAVDKIRNFNQVYIDSNPYWCTCSLIQLLTAYKADPIVFINRDVSCFGPNELKHVRFEDVDLNDLPCNGANVTSVSHDSSLLYQSNLVLDCSVHGDKPLASYWITPWGEKFTTKMAKSIFPKQLSDMKVMESYNALNLLVTSKVYMTDNGSLHIDKYRGYFSGDFTCVGFNLVSTSNETIYLGVETKLTYLYITSLYIGAYCSGAMLGLAVIIGLVRLFVNKCLHSDQCNCCCCRCDDVEIFEEQFKIEDQEIDVNGSSSIETIEYIDYDPNQSPPNPPVNSPMSRLSPGVCRTPNSETEDQSKVCNMQKNRNQSVF